MKNVYNNNIERGIKKLSDGRKYPKYKTAQIIILLIFGDVHKLLSLASE